MTWRTRLAIDVTVILLCVGGLVYFTIAYVATQERRICGLITLLDGRNQKLPPGDADTQQFRTELHRYRTGLGC